VVDPTADPAGFRSLVEAGLASDDLTVIVARRPCLLAARKARQREQGRKESLGS